MRGNAMMTKPILLALMTLGLAACVQQPQAPKEDARLKEAYSACITTAEGSPEKTAACRSVLDVLRKRKRTSNLRRRACAPWIISSVLKRRMPEMGRRYNHCDQIWQEIRHHNTVN
jgi:hypothetical protein